MGWGNLGQKVSRTRGVTMTLTRLVVDGPLSEQVIRINCSVSAMPGSSGLLGPAAGLLGAVVPVASPVLMAAVCAWVINLNCSVLAMPR